MKISTVFQTNFPFLPSRFPFFYGWVIVASGAGSMALGSALLFHAFGAYVVLLQDEFSWSRTTLALAFAMQRVESGLLGPVDGWLVDRFGPRKMMLVGVVIFGIGFMILLTSIFFIYYLLCEPSQNG